MSFLRLSLFIALISLTGCLEAKKKPVDYGPENTVEEVNKALSLPLKDYSPLTMQLGERASWDFYYYIRNSSENRILMSTFTNEVINRTENTKTDSIDFRIQLSATKFDSQGTPSKPVVGQTDYSVVKPFVPTPESLMSLMNLNLFSGEQLAAANQVTIHRLKVEDVFVTLPDTVKDKSICTKWENCKMPASKIHFETVEYKSDGPERTERDYIMTPHLPFVSMLHSELESKEGLPSNLHTCITKQIPVEGKKYTVSFCSSITDFAFGKTE